MKGFSEQKKYQSEVMRKTFFINLDFTSGYYAVHLKYKESNDKYNMDPSYHNEIFENVTKYMSNNEIHVLMGQKTDSLLLLLPQKQLGQKTVQVRFIRLCLFSERLHDAIGL